jgi:hypothetical protein
MLKRQVEAFKGRVAIQTRRHPQGTRQLNKVLKTLKIFLKYAKLLKNDVKMCIFSKLNGRLCPFVKEVVETLKALAPFLTDIITKVFIAGMSAIVSRLEEL